MSGAGAFDIVIFGFRNDIARARVLDFLHQLPLAQSGSTLIDRDTSMPQRLFAALEHREAQRLRDQLEDLGAQVMLLEASAPTAHEPLKVLTAPVTPPSSGIRAFTLLLVIGLGAASYLWRATQPTHGRQSSPSRAQLVGPREPAYRHAEPGSETAANTGTGNPAADGLDDAVDDLELAARSGERLDVLQMLGVTYMRQGEYARAAAALERALRIAPSDRNTLLMLAQVRLKQDRRPQAFDLLQRAKEAGASGPDLDKLLQQLSREVDAEWNFVQLESRHFRVSFADDDDRRAVRQVLSALEDAYDTVGSKFDYYPEERTPVVLYTQQDFHAVTQTPDWAGAAFDGRIKLPVRGLTSDEPDLARVVAHEYAHSLVARLSDGPCPVWLNEGLAVWAEEVENGDHEAWAKTKIADQELFSLEQLNGSFEELPAERAQVAYAESYLAVRALADRYGSRKLPALLHALSRTHNLADAFAATYPGDLSGFQQQLLRQLAG
jgi:tetratricopeptide (TPR) repeat protein